MAISIAMIKESTNLTWLREAQKQARDDDAFDIAVAAGDRIAELQPEAASLRGGFEALEPSNFAREGKGRWTDGPDAVCSAGATPHTAPTLVNQANGRIILKPHTAGGGLCAGGSKSPSTTHLLCPVCHKVAPMTHEPNGHHVGHHLAGAGTPCVDGPGFWQGGKNIKPTKPQAEALPALPEAPVKRPDITGHLQALGALPAGLEVSYRQMRPEDWSALAARLSPADRSKLTAIFEASIAFQAERGLSTRGRRQSSDAWQAACDEVAGDTIIITGQGPVDVVELPMIGGPAPADPTPEALAEQDEPPAPEDNPVDDALVDLDPAEPPPADAPLCPKCGEPFALLLSEDFCAGQSFIRPHGAGVCETEGKLWIDGAVVNPWAWRKAQKEQAAREIAAWTGIGETAKDALWLSNTAALDPADIPREIRRATERDLSDRQREILPKLLAGQKDSRQAQAEELDEPRWADTGEPVEDDAPLLRVAILMEKQREKPRPSLVDELSRKLDRLHEGHRLPKKGRQARTAERQAGEEAAPADEVHQAEEDVHQAPVEEAPLVQEAATTPVEEVPAPPPEVEAPERHPGGDGAGWLAPPPEVEDVPGFDDDLAEQARNADDLKRLLTVIGAGSVEEAMGLVGRWRREDVSRERSLSDLFRKQDEAIRGASKAFATAIASERVPDTTQPAPEPQARVTMVIGDEVAPGLYLGRFDDSYTGIVGLMKSCDGWQIGGLGLDGCPWGQTDSEPPHHPSAQAALDHAGFTLLGPLGPVHVVGTKVKGAEGGRPPLDGASIDAALTENAALAEALAQAPHLSEYSVEEATRIAFADSVAVQDIIDRILPDEFVWLDRKLVPEFVSKEVSNLALRAAKADRPVDLVEIIATAAARNVKVTVEPLR